MKRHSNPQMIAHKVLKTCKPGRVLDYGCDTGELVMSFLAEGVDAYGVSALRAPVASWPLSGRLHCGELLRLPYRDASFDTVVVLGVLEQMDPEDVAAAQCEILRVARCDLYVHISTSPGDDRKTVRSGEWWERTFLEAGFRRHPLSGRIEEFDHEAGTWRIILLFEKRPGVQRAPGWDGLNNPGPDARRVLSRWQSAALLLIPGDHVAVETSEIECCRYVLHRNQPGVTFGNWEDANVVVTFPREGVQTSALSIELYARTLPPGGRLLCGVDLSLFGTGDKSWRALVEGIGSRFLIEQFVVQCGIHHGGETGPPATEVYETRDTLDSLPDGCEYCMIVGRRSPLESGAFHHPFPNLLNRTSPPEAQGSWARDFWHIELYYSRPAIIPGLTLLPLRIRSSSLLTKECFRTLGQANPDSADYGAALCVIVYQQISGRVDPRAMGDEVAAYLRLTPQNRHVLRWQISLAFASALLNLRLGRLDQARDLFAFCVDKDALVSCIHLATKTTEAYFWLGWLAFCRDDVTNAHKWWLAGVQFGRRLMTQDLRAVLINPEWPNLFGYGDGLRELIYSLENVAKCANGIHVLRRDSGVTSAAWEDVNNCFHFQLESYMLALERARLQMWRVSGDLHQASEENSTLRGDLLKAREELASRTRKFEEAISRFDKRAESSCVEIDRLRQENDVLREDLIAVRRELASRTRRLEEALAHPELEALRQANASLHNDLVSTREILIERTGRLEEALSKIQSLKASPWVRLLNKRRGA